MKKIVITTLLSVLPVSLYAASEMADGRISDIRNTKHNFSAIDVPTLPSGESRNVSAASEKQVCVFCHTPHGNPSITSNAGPFSSSQPFLWNRQDSAATYTPYNSTSLDIADGEQTPGFGSKMCLSCHDGTVAIGQVNMLNSQGSQTIAMTGSGLDGDTLAAGTDGYTSNLGTDLSNDHPVGFTYNKQLATDDNELIDPEDPGEGTHIGIRVGAGVANFNQSLVDGGSVAGTEDLTDANTRISVPLESPVTARTTGQTSFVSVSVDGKVECTTCHDPHIRSTDFSENIKFLRLHRFQKSEPTDIFDKDKDINCLACHKKAGWEQSAHALSTTADATYTDTAANLREFPIGTQVWESGCSACHDTHTKEGARWLLREGATGAAFAGESTIQTTCFQCHTSSGLSVLDSSNPAKDIATINGSTGGHSAFDFAGTEDLHQITNGDFIEDPANFKATKRHVTCTDCHNPHRIVQNSRHDGTGIDSTPTALHKHEAGTAHSNIASGALSGISGVEPVYDIFVAGTSPYSTNSLITYGDQQSGNPQLGEHQLKGQSGIGGHVEKEYQICLKCHSNYGLDEATEIGAAPLKANAAIEFHQGNSSFHPVIFSSSENTSGSSANIVATTDANNFVSPFDEAVGTQTMYCSDCHNADSDPSDTTIGVQGPHGESLAAATGDDMCITCHKTEQYKTYNAAATVQNSGFSCAAGDCANAAAASMNNNLHVYHADQTGGSMQCDNCHVKVPHGWRNKALLADTNEADPDGLKDRYYPDAIININDVGIPASGAWKRTDCTASGCHI